MVGRSDNCAVWSEAIACFILVTQVSLKSEYFYLNRSLGWMRFVEELANFFCGFSAEGGFTAAIADFGRNVFYEDGFAVDVKNFVHLLWVRLGCATDMTLKHWLFPLRVGVIPLSVIGLVDGNDFNEINGTVN